jgi:hypothetical protein
MLPFKVCAVVACDDIRIEQGTNKSILIGVYNGSILFPSFPGELSLAWWIQISVEKIGRFEFDLRLVKDDNATLLRAIFAFEGHHPGWASIPLPKAQIQMQSPGNCSLQLKLRDESEWTTIYKFDVQSGVLQEGVLKPSTLQA